MAGLIWNVQVVQYPLFHQVGKQEFKRYHFGHCLRIGIIVTPLLLGEALTGGWLLWAGERRPAFLIALALMVMNWLSTAIFQAPIHTRLMRGYDEHLVRRVVNTNWIRTLGWTVRGGILAWMLK